MKFKDLLDWSALLTSRKNWERQWGQLLNEINSEMLFSKICLCDSRNFCTNMCLQKFDEKMTIWFKFCGNISRFSNTKKTLFIKAKAAARLQQNSYTLFPTFCSVLSSKQFLGMQSSLAFGFGQSWYNLFYQILVHV